MFDPHHQWLGIRPTGKPIDHYRLLGLDVFEDNREVIANAADRQMAHVRGFQNGRQAEASQRLLAEIAAARLCLMDDSRKHEYDAMLSKELLASGAGPAGDGAAFGEFLLMDLLAVASASTIYQAEHRTMQRIVALQTLTADITVSPNEVHRFRRKAAILGKFDHPNLVTVYDAGVRDGVHCLVMELIIGESLHSQIRQPLSTNPAELKQIVEWTKQAAAGLGHAHARGVIHRRVAPSNLLVDANQSVKVVGFGLALLPTDDSNDPAPEKPGATVGNIDYVAPEQLEDSRAIDHRADIYGLGCTLSALMRRRPPFSGKKADKIIQHQAAAPPRVSNVKGSDVALEKIVHRMMAKEPDERYQSMYEVIQALQSWLLNQPSEPTTTIDIPVVVQVRK